MEFTKENALAILKNRVELPSVGQTYKGVRVIHVSDVMEGVSAKGDYQYAIINFAAMTTRQAEFAAEQFAAGNYEAAVNGTKEFGRTLLSANKLIVDGDIEGLPAKGDICNVRLANIKNRAGMTVTVVDAFSVAPVVMAKRSRFADGVVMPEVGEPLEY
jgi:hypothetical protein